jgi:hypothetical protein
VGQYDQIPTRSKARAKMACRERLSKHPKLSISFQIRVLDWGTPWGIDDDDVALFLRSAFGDQWPEPVDDKKKD